MGCAQSQTQREVAISDEAATGRHSDAVTFDVLFGPKESAADGVPQHDTPVVASGNNDPSIAGEGDRPYGLVVSLESSHERAAGGVPEPESLVRASGNNELSIRREGDRPHTLVVSLEGSHERGTGGVPELERPVIASGNNDPSVGGEGDSLDRG